MAELQISALRKSYGTFTALNGVDLEVGASELVALLGPSGCGKTTILRSIAGFIPVTSGQITINGKDVTHLAPQRRNTGMVFQNYALFPHMTVEQNVGFGLEMRKIARDEIRRRVAEALDLVSLSAFAQRMPQALSGGQQQRVAVARALVVQPDVFLLDEPLSNLDAKLRQSVGMQLRALQTRLGLTTVFVTHDQKEALMMADRLVIMRNGRIVQQGDTQHLYAHPATRFVADFLGAANVLPGRIHPEGFEIGGGTLVRCDTGKARPDMVLSVRPENVVLSPAAGEHANSFTGTVQAVTYLGGLVEVEVVLPGGAVVTAHHPNRIGTRPVPDIGSDVTVGWHPEATQILVDDL
ncbi:MAG: ABC transporter ATP-binding protein [Paracoccus sp. (in: a-proteobacteria)]|uniref:ABC transporter ATP-binding protein n=1 Tax=Paracoccus sp. TaxID=267 RepID=UPI003919D8F9